MEPRNNPERIGGLRLILRSQTVVKADFTAQAYLKIVGNRFLVDLHADFVVVKAALCADPLHSPSDFRLRFYIKNRIRIVPGRPQSQTDCIPGVRLIGIPVILCFIAKQRFSVNHTYHSLAFFFYSI